MSDLVLLCAHLYRFYPCVPRMYECMMHSMLFESMTHPIVGIFDAKCFPLIYHPRCFSSRQKAWRQNAWRQKALAVGFKAKAPTAKPHPLHPSRLHTPPPQQLPPQLFSGTRVSVSDMSGVKASATRVGCRPWWCNRQGPLEACCLSSKARGSCRSKLGAPLGHTRLV
jgi:hypothetical protein